MTPDAPGAGKAAKSLTRKEALEHARHDATLLNHINEADRLGLAADWIQMEFELHALRAALAERDAQIEKMRDAAERTQSRA